MEKREKLLIQQSFNNGAPPTAGSNKWNIPPATHGLGEYSEQVSDESVEYLVFKQCILEKKGVTYHHTPPPPPTPADRDQQVTPLPVSHGLVEYTEQVSVESVEY